MLIVQGGGGSPTTAPPCGVHSRMYYQVKLRNRNLVTCTLFSLLWYEIKDVPIYRCKSFKFRTLGVKFRYIYCSSKKNTKCTLKLQNYYIKTIC